MNKTIRVITKPATADLTCTLLACLRTCRSSSRSSIFSTFSPSWREPRAASPTQVLSRHWKKPDAAPANKGKRPSRHQGLIRVASKTVKTATPITSMIKPPISRLRRSFMLMLGVQTSPVSDSIFRMIPQQNVHKRRTLPTQKG